MLMLQMCRIHCLLITDQLGHYLTSFELLLTLVRQFTIDNSLRQQQVGF